MNNSRWRGLAGLTLGLALLTVLTACSSGALAPGMEGTLAPGGSYEDDSGVVLNALSGALTEGVDVAVDQVAAPPEPVPNYLRVISPYYQLRASAETYANQAPFAIAVPVPVGAQTENLALAFLSETGDILDGHEASGRTWQVLSGVYDADGGYFVTTFALLSKLGRTVVLVQNSGVSSPSLGGAAVVSPQQDAGQFVVSCTAFEDSGLNPDGVACTDTDEADLETILEAAFADYTGLGFVLPYLERQIDPATSTYTPNNPNIMLGEYLAQLRPIRTVEPGADLWPCGNDGTTVNLGGYNSATQRFFVCIGAGGITASTEGTARHEYFHATQYGYQTVRHSRAAWVLESTAVAAQNSLGTMARATNRGLREVDEPITATEPGLVEYRTQDFFVYVGNRLGRGLEYLTEVFGYGAGTQDIDQALNQVGLGGLAAVYWDWAKNQAVEAQLDHAVNTLGSQCWFAVGTAVPHEIQYSHLAPPAGQTVIVQPLSSAVVRIRLQALPDVDYSVGISAAHAGAGQAGNIRFKLYDPADAATSNCWAKPDSSSINVTVPAGNTRFVYALISNLSAPGLAGATLSFGNVTPNIQILSPTNGAQLYEDQDVQFLAVASGFAGVDPSFVSVNWSYPRYDGVPIIFSTGNGQAALRTLCDGNYTATATALNALNSQQVSATVSFTVQNSWPPPAQCAPSIQIIDPDDGATFSSDQAITFNALFDDDKPGISDPIYPLIWRLGGPTGLIIHRDSASFTYDKFPEGLHEIHVQYGSASDSISIVVIDSTNAPPTAQITYPQDNTLFSYVDLGFNNPTILLTGVGTDPEDGGLPAASLAWAYRRLGDPQWIQLGTGTTRQMPVIYTGENISTFEVRLRVTDSGGLISEHIIRVRVLNPPT